MPPLSPHYLGEKALLEKTENYPQVKVHHDEATGKTIVDIKLYEDPIPMPLHMKPVTSGECERIRNLVSIIDGYFENNGFHVQINAVTREILQDAYNNPDKYPSLCIRVSGYSIAWGKLSREQQLEVLQRTIHETM
jgi:pyruvate-formate lyase